MVERDPCRRLFFLLPHLWLGPWVSCPELVRLWDVRYQVSACCELGVSGHSARQKLSLWV